MRLSIAILALDSLQVVGDLAEAGALDLSAQVSLLETATLANLALVAKPLVAQQIAATRADPWATVGSDYCRSFINNRWQTPSSALPTGVCSKGRVENWSTDKLAGNREVAAVFER